MYAQDTSVPVEKSKAEIENGAGVLHLLVAAVPYVAVENNPSQPVSSDKGVNDLAG